MRLSEAIMLGSATCKLSPADINACAFGCALNSMGVPHSSLFPETNGIGGKEYARYLEARRIWPWIGDIMQSGAVSFGTHIFTAFDNNVCSGEMTLEQLVDYVRSIEPDCDCNRFNCDCAKPGEVSVQQEVAAL
jgi:hypothetical protein